MATSTRSVFRTSALLSGLVSQEQIDRAVAVIRATSGGLGAGSEVDDEQLSAKLVELEAITSYQAEQLRAGRTKLNLGPYVITQFIGQGGMGQVYKAVHKMMGRECAVKVLPLNKATPETIQNFTRRSCRR